MTTLIPVPRPLLKRAQQELIPLLSETRRFSSFCEYPRIVTLKNPDLSETIYDAWRRDYGFGKETLPQPDETCWDKKGVVPLFIDLLQTSLIPVSATIVEYDGPRHGLGYHKDPGAYTLIASFTLEGSGDMWVWRRPGKSRRFRLDSSQGVCLLKDDCLLAKHKVSTDKSRIGLVLRFTPA